MKDETGKRYGCLRVMQIGGRTNGQIVWQCLCDCGSVTNVRGSLLRQKQTRSCGHLRKGNSKLPSGEASKRNLLRSYKYSARKRGHVWQLSDGEFYFLIGGCCRYCGANPAQVHTACKASNGSIAYNGVDRVKNDLGYIAGNVVPCCKQCNTAKNTMSREEFLTWVRRVFDFTFGL